MITSRKKKAPKEDHPDLYDNYRSLINSLLDDLKTRDLRIMQAREYLDRNSIFGFVWANGVRKTLLPHCLNTEFESDLFRYWREAKEYIREVCF